MPEPARTNQEIRIGFQRHTPPFSYSIEGAPTFHGYSVALAREVLHRLVQAGVCASAVVDVAVTSSTREGLLLSRAIDLKCGSTTITASRQDRHAFSHPIFLTRHRLALKRGREARPSLRVVGIQGSTSHSALLDAGDEASPHVFVGVSSIGEARTAFIEDPGLDAMVADEVILRSLLNAALAAGEVHLLETAFGADAYGFMVRHEDHELLQQVNTVLTDIFADVRWRRDLASWFTEPLPTLDFALQMDVRPMLEDLALSMACTETTIHDTLPLNPGGSHAG